jgi:hypothetical protein
MEKRILMFAMSIFLVSIKLAGQIAVSLEAGISYWPFALETLNSGTRYSNRIDYLVGVSGTVPVHEMWHLNMRLSYSSRENMRWRDLAFCPGYEYSEYTHNDLNIDFSVRYQALSKVSLWAGPSIVRKINSASSLHSVIGSPCESATLRIDRFIYGFNLASSTNIKGLIIKAEYAHLFWKDPELRTYRKISGRHRYNLVLSYPVFKGKNR